MQDRTRRTLGCTILNIFLRQSRIDVGMRDGVYLASLRRHKVDATMGDLMTLTGDRGCPIVCGRWTSLGHKNREVETQASGVADTADVTEARSKRFILYICRPQMHASHRSLRIPWFHKSTWFRARLALSPGVSHKNINKLT